MSEANIESVSPGQYKIIGEMTFDTARQLCKQEEFLFRKGEDIMLDLGQVSRVDSAGLACLLEFIRQAKSHEVELSFVNIQNQLSTLIKLSGLESLVKDSN